MLEMSNLLNEHLLRVCCTLSLELSQMKVIEPALSVLRV